MGKKLTLRDDLIPLVQNFASAKGDDSLGAAMNRLIYLGLRAEGFINQSHIGNPSQPTRNDDDLEVLGGIDL
jgi:hypothetical protein